MKIVVAGGSGFIGEALVQALTPRGDTRVLTRDPSRVSDGRGLRWNPPAAGEWESDVADADVVINLAGASIADGRWTEERKKLLVSSRVDATTALVTAMSRAPLHPRVFVSASAVGIYPDRGDDEITEQSDTGSGFLPDLARAWEGAANAASSFARLVVPRFGIVLGKGGGALKSMVPPFRFGVGGPLGSGLQWMPWVSLRDTIRAIEWMIDNESARGAYNVVAPHPVTNAEFSKQLASLLGRPAFLRAPAFALRAALGEMADDALLVSQRVIPAKLLDQGFRFENQDVRSALADALL